MRVYTGRGVEEERKTDMMAPGAAAEVAAMMMPTTTTSKVEGAGRLPSIEMLPKTLTLDQIKDARETALYAVSTKAEAVRIFTAGLKPVQMSNVRNNKSSSVNSSDDDVDLGSCFLDAGGGGSKDGCRGRRTSSVDIRDIATASF